MENTLTSRQVCCVTAMFIIGSSVVADNSYKSEQNLWISIVSAFAVSLPIMMIYCRLQRLFPGKNLFEIMHIVFGKLFGNVLTVIYLLFFVYLSIIPTNIFTIFVKLNALPTVPPLITALAICILAAYLTSLKRRRFGKVASILLLVVITDALVSTLFSLDSFELKYLLPILKTDIVTLTDDALSYVSVPLTQTVALLCIFHDFPAGKLKYRYWVIGASIGTGIILINFLRSVLILGGEAISSYYFTTYISTSVIRINSFIQRIEIFVTSAFLACLLVKLSVYFYAIGNGCLRIFPKINKTIAVYGIAVVVALLSPYIFDSAEAVFSWLKTTKGYVLILQVGIPVLLWIVGEIMNRKKKPAEETVPAKATG